MIPYSLFSPNISFIPEHNVVTTGVPTTKASVAAVLNPSSKDGQINQSHLATYLYGFVSYPRNVKESAI